MKLNHHLSHPFETNVGVVQGDPLSIFHTQYADDTTLHAADRIIIGELVPKCQPVFTEDNLKSNTDKTQYFCATKTQPGNLSNCWALY